MTMKIEGIAVEPLSDVSDLSIFTGLTKHTIRKLVRRGELSALRMGREYRFRKQDIDSYLQRCEASAVKQSQQV